MPTLRVVTIEYAKDGSPLFVKAEARDELDRSAGVVVITQSELASPLSGSPTETWAEVLGWLGDMLADETPGYRRGAPPAAAPATEPRMKKGRLAGAWSALMGRE
jgi:hypothetical protein